MYRGSGDRRRIRTVLETGLGSKWENNSAPNDAAEDGRIVVLAELKGLPESSEAIVVDGIRRTTGAAES